jgi:hypothetical protein
MALAYLTAQSRPKRLHVHAADAVLAGDGLFRGATKGIEMLGNANGCVSARAVPLGSPHPGEPLVSEFLNSLERGLMALANPFVESKSLP